MCCGRQGCFTHTCGDCVEGMRYAQQTREMKRNTLAAFIGAAALAFCGCKSSHEHGGSMHDGHTGGGMGSRAKAIAILSPTSGNNVQGKVFFTPETEGVRVEAEITGLTPGKHGFHIHEKGDCSAPDATSAGGHFNPSHGQHGAPTSVSRHAGDFGNITADANGVAHFERVDNNIKLDGTNSVIGKAVIVHAKEDDLTSQPAGNAGARVACGLIQNR